MSKTKKLLTFTIVFLTASVALAAEKTENGLTMTLINMILPAVSLIAVFLATKLIKALETKTGIQLSSDNYNKLMDQVDLAVHYAAEQAAKAGDKKLAGNAKLAVATKYARDAIVNFKLGDIAEDKLQALIEAKLNVKKTAGKL